MPSIPVTCICFHSSGSFPFSSHQNYPSYVQIRRHRRQPDSSVASHPLLRRCNWLPQEYQVNLVSSLTISVPTEASRPLTFSSAILALARSTMSNVSSAILSSSVKCLSPSFLYFSILSSCCRIVSSSSSNTSWQCLCNSSVRVSDCVLLHNWPVLVLVVS